MSNIDEERRNTESIEEAEEAFIDLEDPNLEILEDEDDVNANENTSDNDNEEADGGSGDHRNVGAADADENEEENEGDALQPDAEMIDLNAVPDREPERDDALRTFYAPEGKPIHAMAVHPVNPRIVAAAGEGEEVYIFSLPMDPASTELTPVQTLKGHSDTVSLLSFSPNGEWLATGSLDSTVGLWSTSSWERVHSLTDLYGEILCLLWHPSSLVLIAGADDAQAGMWNVSKGTLAMYFVGHRGPLTCCAWSPDFKKLVTGSSDGSIAVYNPKTGEQEVTATKDLSPDNAGVTRLAFVNDDQCVVGCEDGTLHVFSLRGGKIVSHLAELHEQAIESLAVNDNGTLLLSSSCDCKLIVWNVNDFSPRTTLQVGESVIPAAWARGVFAVAGCSDGDIRVWDGRSSQQEPLITFMGHRRMVLSLAISTAHADDTPRRDYVLSGGDDGMVKCFPLPDMTV